MFRSVAFEPRHLDDMDMREFEAKRLNREQMFEISKRGQTQTMYAGETIVMVVGFYHLFSRVIEVYIVPSIHMHKYPITVVRELRRFLSALEQSSIHRIQTLALKDMATTRWMMALGFEFEGTLAKYTNDGLDFNMWARVKQ